MNIIKYPGFFALTIDLRRVQIRLCIAAFPQPPASDDYVNVLDNLGNLFLPGESFAGTENMRIASHCLAECVLKRASAVTTSVKSKTPAL